MRAAIFIFFLILTSTVIAKSKGKAKIVETKEDKPYRDPTPGGAKADHHFYKQWVGMIEPQHFPQLPPSSKLEKDGDKLPSLEKRQRYIFQMDASLVDLKNEIWDEGYYYYAYSDKEQGDLLLVVHPKYRKCFDDLKKKFDYMQWEVFEYGELAGRKQIVLEYPRQCLGQLKDTGSKLPSALGAFGQK